MSTIPFVFANNVNTTLSGAITSPSQTTITLSSTTNLPTIAGGQYWALTLNDAATQSVFEVVYVTARTGGSLTVLRGQEGTTATTWLVNDYAYADVTAGILANFAYASGAGATALDTSSTAQSKTGALTLSGGGTFSGTFGGSPTFSGSVTIASLTLSSPLAIAQGGTGSTTQNFVDLTTNQTIGGGKTFSSSATVQGSLTVNNVIVSTTSLSSPGSYTAGDIIAQRGASTGAIWFGGSTLSGFIDWNLDAAGAFAMRTYNGSSYSYSNVFLASLTANGNVGALGGLLISSSGAYSAPATVATGDAVFQRSSATGSLWLGGNSAYGAIDYNVNNTAAISFTSASGPVYTALHAASYNVGSDAAFKKNIAPIQYGTKEILALKPSSFTLIATNTPGLGFVAQQLQVVLPELVTPDAQGTLSAQYDGVIPVLVKAFQELHTAFTSYVAAHP